MTFKEIYNQVMPEKKRKEERFNIFAHWIGRPISILMTLPLINTRIKPTSITKLSIIFVTIGFFMISFSTSVLGKFIGWLCFFMWNLLDGVDGNLARCTKQCSPMGDLWDTTAGYIAMIFTYFSASISGFFDINKIIVFDNYWILILGGATAIMSIFPRLVMHKKKSSNFTDDGIKKLSDKQNFGLKNIIAMNFISPSGFMQIIFLICIMYHLLNLFIIFYFLVNLAIMLLSLYQLLKE